MLERGAGSSAFEVTNARTLFEFPTEFNAFGTPLLGIPAIFLGPQLFSSVGRYRLEPCLVALIYAIGNNEEAVRLSATIPSFTRFLLLSFRSDGRHRAMYMSRLTSPFDPGQWFRTRCIARRDHWWNASLEWGPRYADSVPC